MLYIFYVVPDSAWDGSAKYFSMYFLCLCICICIFFIFYVALDRARDGSAEYWAQRKKFK